MWCYQLFETTYTLSYYLVPYPHLIASTCDLEYNSSILYYSFTVKTNLGVTIAPFGVNTMHVTATMFTPNVE